MISPKILVTICNYNHFCYLKEAIDSIQNQSYTNLDICVVDDGSVDSEVVRKLLNNYNSDNRIRSIFQSNYGKWHALNEAIRTTDAMICTSHDADDISLKDRIACQLATMLQTDTWHNLCGFYHCWNEDDVNSYRELRLSHESELRIIESKTVSNLVLQGYNHPSINHYFTGEFETAGVSAMFYREIWLRGLRFHPPQKGIRVLLSEDSDFNFRVTCSYNKTSVVAEKLYLYRRNTSTNKELI